MGAFEQFPYTNFHELNLDYLINEIKKIYAKIEELDPDALKGFVTEEELTEALLLYIRYSDLIDIMSEYAKKNYVDQKTAGLITTAQVNALLRSYVYLTDFNNLLNRYETSEAKLEKIGYSSYQAGETISINPSVICAGFVTAAAKSLYIQIPLYRGTIGRTANLTLNSNSGLCVRVPPAGFLDSTTYIDPTLINIETVPNEAGLRLTITKKDGSAFANVQTNAPVIAAIIGTITFS